MAGAVQCPTCNSFYNGAVYSTCPYCAKRGKQNIPKVQAQEKEKKNIFGFLKRTKGENATERSGAAGDAAVQNNAIAGSVQQEFSRRNITEQDGGYSVTVPMYFTPLNEEHSREPEKTEERDHVEKTEREPLGNEKKVTDETAAPKAEDSLRNQISRVGRTVGKYVSSDTDESYQPVVGWLVSVKGDCYGQSFHLKSGINRIGRSTEMDVKLLQDQSVSRKEVASIVFDSRSRQFSILPGTQSGDLIYLDGNALYERQSLKGYEKIEFGDSNLNMYLFVPFCGENFSWEDYTK
uniref:FHA domain-containing protein n=1 Tax=Eubacterium cellulosolvens TaxID=29322 RepID=UPI0006842F85|nr:FHA domain-containing protein [[Eubacterium] cellulosolvens]